MTVLACFLCLPLTSTLAACTAGPTPEPSERFTTNSSPAPTSPNATFQGVGLDVAFSFDYPTTWTVADSDPTNRYEGGDFMIANEAGVEVASLVILPSLHVSPCRGVCGEGAVSYLGVVHGQGTLAAKSFVVQTKAMDLTSREDLQEANAWDDNIRLITGVAGVTSNDPVEDPVHFSTMAGIRTGSTAESSRPIIFGAYRYFSTMAEAKAYTSSKEHRQIQTMMRSLNASAVGDATTNTTSTRQ